MLRAQGTLFTIVFAIAAVWLRSTCGSRSARSATCARCSRPARASRSRSRASSRCARSRSRRGHASSRVLIGLFASNRWETWLAWRNAVAFGQADPILGRDVSFYVFSLPFLQLVRGLGQTLVVLAALVSGALYLLSGSLTSGFPARMSMTPAARRHLALLAAVFLLLLAIGRVAQPVGAAASAARRSSTARATPTSTAGCRRRCCWRSSAVIGAGLALLQAFTPRNWPIPVAVALYLVVSVGGEIYSTMLQRFVVTPNEQAREAPYIQHNIEATRRAFALDQVEEREISGDALLTREDIANNAPTLENVRLWDHQPLLETFGQIQEIRTYYDFVVGGQRPLPDRRTPAPGDALGAAS